jgi:hypothetical protein
MNDKKKIAIVGALVAALLAVGAFQFMQPGAPAVVDPGAEAPEVAANEGADPTAAADPNAPPKIDPVRQALLNMATASATPRDPFIPSGELVAEFANAMTKTPPQSAAPGAVAGNPPPPAAAPAPSERAPYIPAMNPLPGGLNPQQGGQVGVNPIGQGSPTSDSSRNPEQLGYKVRGVIVGTSRMVVLEDSSGNQKLVPEGASIDGDSTVVGIRGNEVVIRHRGRKAAVKLEEDSR